MRMRILKKHGTGIPDAQLSCLGLSLLDFQHDCFISGQDKVVALIREEFGAAVPVLELQRLLVDIYQERHACCNRKNLQEQLDAWRPQRSSSVVEG